MCFLCTPLLIWRRLQLVNVGMLSSLFLNKMIFPLNYKCHTTICSHFLIAWFFTFYLKFDGLDDCWHTNWNQHHRIGKQRVSQYKTRQTALPIIFCSHFIMRIFFIYWYMYKRNFNRARKHIQVTRHIREFENDDDDDVTMLKMAQK